MLDPDGTEITWGSRSMFKQEALVRAARHCCVCRLPLAAVRRTMLIGRQTFDLKRIDSDYFEEG